MKKLKTFFVGALAALSLSLGSVNNHAAVMAPTKISAPARKPISNDGYYFEAHTIESTRIDLTIVKHYTYEDLAKAWKKAGGNAPPKGKYVAAFAAWNKDGSACTIHMVDPAIIYRPQFIGHELVHCMYGSFHPTQG